MNQLSWPEFHLPAIPNPQIWMTQLSGSRAKTFSELTIPGTHESGITSDVPYVGTQNTSITAQLNMGIRAFDLRVGIQDDRLIVNHDGRRAKPDKLYLVDVLSDIYTFLNKHSQEAILVQIKEEGSDPGVEPFADVLSGVLHSGENHNYWNTGDTMPTIEACAKKIQLIRRFHPASVSLPFGIDVTAWSDDSPLFGIPPLTPLGGIRSPSPAFQIFVQDHYTFEGFDEKWQDIQNLLDKAKNDQTSKNWYINYSSAVSAADPEEVAKGRLKPIPSHDRKMVGMNERLGKYFGAAQTQTRYGTIMMDFPESEKGLVLAMIMTNFPPV
ncbi:hypothetical protein AA313_de0202793 [Arthrobotrys entomopaga]|nr:hypothetical protein AA313_de0202793 [Arthrobotrys entomopaga]